MDIQHYMQTLGRQARAASRVLAAASTAAKNAALIAMAGELHDRINGIDKRLVRVETTIDRND